MSAHGPNAHAYAFGPFRFDTRTGELLRTGRVVRLAPQPALVLSLLLESAGEPVAREVLRERLWPDTVVEFDKGLNFCVREVRAALGDVASDPVYLETLPRRGYRFIAPVERVTGLRDPARRILPRRSVGVRVGATVAGLAILVLAFHLSRASFGTRALDPRAREFGEMGGYLLTRGQGDDVERSVEFFRQALAADPGYARAYAGLGSAYLRLSRIGEAKAAFRKSLDIDPRLWASHINLALTALNVEYDPTRAGEHFRRALTLAPQRTVVRHTYAWFLAVTGDLTGAFEQMDAALALDPVSPRVNGDVGRLFYLGGRYDEAVAQCRRTLELLPNIFRPRDCMVQALVEKGALEEARGEAVAAMRAHAASAADVAAAETGEHSQALKVYWRWAAETIAELARSGKDSYVHAAAAWARLGDADRAFEALEEAYAVHCPVLLQMDLDPALRLLREDRRFLEILTRIGLRPVRGGASRYRASLDLRLKIHHDSTSTPRGSVSRTQTYWPTGSASSGP